MDLGEAVSAYTVIHTEEGIIVRGFTMPLLDIFTLMKSWSMKYPDAELVSVDDTLFALRFSPKEGKNECDTDDHV